MRWLEGRMSNMTYLKYMGLSHMMCLSQNWRETWIWQVDHSVDKEPAGWSHPMRVVVNVLMSMWKTVMICVPQGSVLGLALFNIFAGDVDSGSDHCMNCTGYLEMCWSWSLHPWRYSKSDWIWLECCCSCPHLGSLQRCLPTSKTLWSNLCCQTDAQSRFSSVFFLFSLMISIVKLQFKHT